MKKSQLVTKVASEAGISKKQASAALDATLNSVTSALKKGERVTLVGFGTFATSQRKARTSRNPQTGRPIKIAAKRVARFTAGGELRGAVAKQPKPKLDAFEATFEELSDFY
ncbi:MAG TPA: HU family DNA-binding protein [Terriglobales bacterium]|nr:HU family DNA-binding protein [Terriglobales bacterium]